MPRERLPDRSESYAAVIFDVDGVLVASPHERAWQEALAALMAGDWRSIARSTSYAPERFTTDVYQSRVAGKPRMSGARAVLDYFGVPGADRRTLEYAQRKQERIEELIDAGEFVAFDDALRFIASLDTSGIRLAAASSSKNANRFMRHVHLPNGQCLLEVFDANVCGRELKHGKPHPEIFLLAAKELSVAPERCVVVEDAPAGIEAAKAGGMVGLGVARLGDEALLEAELADLVVSTLDDVSVEAFLAGRLARVQEEGAAASGSGPVR